MNVNKLAAVLATPRVTAFVNAFYQRPGFHLVVADLAKGTKKKGALFLIDFVTDAANRSIRKR